MFEVNVEDGTVQLYGEIGDYFENGVSEKDVIKALGDLGGQDITLHIKSDGGDVFQGLSVYNQLVQYDGKITMVVDGIAASIASVIAMSADELQIYENSMLMIHNPWTVAMGDAKEFRDVANLLDKITDSTAQIYAQRSGGDRDDFKALMETDTYLTAEESFEMGLVDLIIPNRKTDSKKQERTAPVTACAKFPNRIAAKHRLRRMRAA